MENNLCGSCKKAAKRPGALYCNDCCDILMGGKIEKQPIHNPSWDPDTTGEDWDAD